MKVTLAIISKRLTEAVIAKAFKRKTNSTDEIQEIIVTRAAAAGEGLLSAVYRIHVTGKNHTASFIAKGLVNDELLKKSLNTEKYNEREVQFYSNVLPALVEMQMSLGAKERILNNVPICYGYHCNGVDDYILLEDLSESNCSSISSSPTEYERDAILKVLAHLHAVSMALKVKKPSEFERIRNTLPEVYYTEANRTWYSQYLQNGIDIDRDILLEFEDENSIYYKKFNEVTKNVYSQLIDLVKQSDYSAICHGDAWCSNFLCSKDRAVAVDFQLLRCASPATDITFFILICSNLIKTKADFLKSVKFYYNSLVYFLEDMGLNASEIFSWSDLEKELVKYGKYGFLGALTTIPLVFSDRCDVLQSFEDKYVGWNEIPLDELWRLTPFKNREDKMRFVNAVRIAVDAGLI